MPRLIATATASVRCVTPSFSKMLEIWFLTVLPAIPSVACDLRVGRAVDDQREHLLLARRQLVAREALREAHREFGGHVGTPLGDEPMAFSSSG